VVLLAICGFNLVLFLVYRFWFFLRNPKRIIPTGNNIVSPADGCILYIKEIQDGIVPVSIKKNVEYRLDDFFEQPIPKFRYIIGIYMTEISVHKNRAPIAGRIVDSKSKEFPNKSMIHMMMNLFFKLYPYEQNSVCTVENTRRVTIIEGEFTVGIIQIADKWINRIDFYKNKNDFVSKGETIGMIRMGSQCDLLISDVKDIKFCVSEGEWVKAGSDIIATYNLKE